LERVGERKIRIVHNGSSPSTSERVGERKIRIVHNVSSPSPMERVGERKKKQYKWNLIF
jgi:hypothetical protein